MDLDTDTIMCIGTNLSVRYAHFLLKFINLDISIQYDQISHDVRSCVCQFKICVD